MQRFRMTQKTVSGSLRSRGKVSLASEEEAAKDTEQATTSRKTDQNQEGADANLC